MKSFFLIVSIFTSGPILMKCNYSTINEGTISSTSSISNSTMTQILRTINTQFTVQPIYLKSTVFEDLICHSKLFIDNSLLIHFLFHNNKVLVTLPHAFGKTVNLQMIKAFFQIEINRTTGEKLKLEQTKAYKIFSKTKMSCDKGIVNLRDKFLIADGNYSDVMKLMGAKPIIHLDLHIPGSLKTLKDVENFMRNRLKSCILEHIYIKHRLLQYKAYHCKYGDLLEQLSSVGLADMSKILPSLAKILEDIFNETVVIMIDEYDSPFNKIVDISNYNQEQKKNTISHISSIYRSLINTTSIQYIFFTGTYCWLDHEMFPELRHFTLNTVGGGAALDFYGFTENQVETIFRKMNLEPYLAKAKAYYKGYDFGDTKEIIKYNPYSIITSAKTKKIGSHWTSIGNISMIIDHLVKYVNFNKMLYQALIGGYISIPIYRSKKNSTPAVSFTFDDFCRLSTTIKNASSLDKIEWYSQKNTDSEIGMRILFATGYLTQVHATQSLDHINLQGTVLAKITNLEIEKYLWSQYDSSLRISTADIADRPQQLYEASMTFNKLMIQLISTNYTNGKQFAIEMKKLLKAYPPLSSHILGTALHNNERIIESIIETHILSNVYKLNIASREIRLMFNWAKRMKPDIVLIIRKKRMVIVEFKYNNSITSVETMNEVKRYATWYLNKRNARIYDHILEFKLVSIIVRSSLKRRIEVNVEILPRDDLEYIFSTSTHN